ncbi:MAG: M20/M25/M40 family metallo-hydrolase, partial [Acidobacteria bacterium]|nr:M20/M25/M40 family metallo-hydrolase [Acidobacteriota bacterium]
MKPIQLLLIGAICAVVWAQNSSISKQIEAAYADVIPLYKEIHQNPELSGHETQTAAKLAGRLRALGYQVSEHVGRTGIVAVLRNGEGPTAMLRTELDALPVEERTGLDYASKARARDEAGNDVAVMHACGHDLHMAAMIGTAEILAHRQSTWHGTLLLVGQPAEETISGARWMVEDGLFTRFPRPDVAVALHVSNEMPAGKIGIVSGIYDTN